MSITDEDQTTIRLTREEQGWMIAGITGSGEKSGDQPRLLEPPVPADEAKVKAFIRRLTELKPQRLVSRTSGGMSRLQVAEEQFVRRIELVADDGRTMVLFLGSSPSLKTIHLRLGNENQVYLGEGITAWEVNTHLSTWWEDDYLDLEPNDFETVSLANGQGSLRLSKKDGNGWQLTDAAADEKVSTAALEEFLYRTGYIPVADYLGREGMVKEEQYGLNRPEARIIFDNGVREIEVRIGRELEDSSQRVVKSSASPFYVMVASHNLTTILEQRREDLLASDEEGRTAEKQMTE
jgi:hypothetical protein